MSFVVYVIMCGISWFACLCHSMEPVTVLRAQSPVYEAIDKNDIVFLNQLFLKPESMNVLDESGKAPIHCAAEKKDGKDLLALLLAMKADVNSCDELNRTPLHYAVVASCDDSVELLVRMNGLCNVQDDMGDTPLHMAARNKNKTYDLLLSACKAHQQNELSGALAIKNNEDMTVSDVLNRSVPQSINKVDIYQDL